MAFITDTLNIANVSKDFGRDKIKDLLAPFGNVLNIFISPRFSPNSWASVTMENPTAANAAIDGLKNHPELKVRASLPKKDLSNVDCSEDGTLNEGLEVSGYRGGKCTFSSHCARLGRFRCSRCKTWYCSQKCQMEDWPRHMLQCQPLPSLEDSEGRPVTSPFPGTRRIPNNVALNSSIPAQILRRPNEEVDEIKSEEIPKAKKEVNNNIEESKTGLKDNKKVITYTEKVIKDTNGVIKETKQIIKVNPEVKEAPKKSDIKVQEKPEMKIEEKVVKKTEPEKPKKEIPVETPKPTYCKLSDGSYSEFSVNPSKDFSVTFLNFESANEIYLTSAENVNKLVEMTEDVEKEVEKSDCKTGFRPPAPGVLCLALASDEGWYRGAALKPDGKDAFEVFFLDFGFKESVPEANLRPMEMDLAKKLPFLAQKCVLDGFKDPKEVKSEVNDKVKKYFDDEGAPKIRVIEKLSPESVVIKIPDLKIEEKAAMSPEEMMKQIQLLQAQLGKK